MSAFTAGGLALSATPAAAVTYDPYPLYGSTPLPTPAPDTRLLADTLVGLEVGASDIQKTTTVGGTVSGFMLRACGKKVSTSPDPAYPNGIPTIFTTTQCGLGNGGDIGLSTTYGIEIEHLEVTYTIKNTAGNGGGGVPLASATFSTGGTTYTNFTLANGTITSPSLNVNNVSGAVTVEATATLPSGSKKIATFIVIIKAGNAVGLKYAPGTLATQQAAIGNSFANLGVVAVDQFGNAAGAGTSVTFTANPVGGATATLSPAGAITTDDGGLAKVTGTASGNIGSYTVTATAASLAGNATYPKTLTFNLTNTAPAKHIAVDASSSATLSAIVDTKFSPLVVKVTDDFGNPVVGQVVTFKVNPVAGASGNFDLSNDPGANPQQVTARTDVSGLATAPDLTANGTVGSYTATASFSTSSIDANGNPVTFSGSTTFNLTNGDAGSTLFTIVEGDDQKTPVNTNFRVRLKVKATLNGAPLKKALVKFKAPTSGASGYFINDGAGQTGEQSVYTDDAGIAEASVFRANGTTGGPYDVTANLSSATTGGTTFHLTNTSGAVYSAVGTVVAGSPPGLEVKVTDQQGAALAGVPVTFKVVKTGPGGGATLKDAANNTSTSQLVVTTDASGVARVTATPGTDLGAYQIKAFVEGLSTPVLFNLENTPGGGTAAPAAAGAAATAGLQAISDLTQSAMVGTAFQPFKVRVVDDQGRGVNGIDVTFTVTTAGNGATGLFASAAPVTTAANNPDGSATSSILTANATIGQYTVVASATINGNPQSVTFTVSNTAGPPANLTVVSGTPQTTPRSAAFPNPLIVQVTDAAGRPAAGVEVVFTAPEPLIGANSVTVQPSGTFANGSNKLVVKTDVNGIATSTVFTANTTYGAYKVVASVTGTNLRGDFQLSNEYSDQFVRDRTTRVIKNFMVRRGEQITSSEPDLTRRLNRGAGQGATNGGVAFAGSGDDEGSTMTVATSLYDIYAARKQKKASDTNELAPAMGLGATDRSVEEQMPTTGLDVWVDGKWSRINQDTATNDTALLYVGVDYRFRSGLVLGVLGQLDHTTETDNVGALSALDTVEASGNGWMVGPYMVAPISENLIFDARGAWGESDNKVNPLGLYTDSFDGQRWLAKAQLTGDFRYGMLQFSPHVGVVYFEETQSSYIDTLGVMIPEQTVSLGRMTFGPKFAMHVVTENGTTVAPYAAVKGIWDFTSSDEIVSVVSGDEIGATSKDLRARTEGGIAITLPNGASIAGEGFLDGLGTNEFTAYGGSARVNVPLH